MLMNLKAQEYVCTLADSGTYSRASELLYISQPTLSMYIKNLEKSLGTPLFTKESKKMVPTFIGEKYLEASRKMLESEKEFEKILQSYQSGHSGFLRIGTYLRLSPLLLPPTMVAFIKKYPLVEIKITEDIFTILTGKLKSGELDLILCNHSSNLDDFSSIHIMDDHLLMALQPNHPAVENAKHLPGLPYPWLDLKYLKDDRFIIQNDDQMIRKFTDRALTFSQVIPKQVLKISNIETAVQMASEGIGPAFCMESYLKTFRTFKPVNYFLVGDVNVFANLSICYRKEFELNDFMEYFVEQITYQL
ncbi:LysR family transcriptional regulator [Lacrimispora sp.]|uniref:LysR family transcriptional regulator n=1 Tax=Lacrimispora sp. TaxID=2719234 RepID=UPI0028A2A36E|nr:LysR family transcriptional regulator [Lacrimispora sp.]